MARSGKPVISIRSLTSTVPMRAHGFGKDLLLFFLSDLAEDDFVTLNQQHVFHLGLLKKFNASR
jgi:hypothetical protein